MVLNSSTKDIQGDEPPIFLSPFGVVECPVRGIIVSEPDGHIISQYHNGIKRVIAGTGKEGFNGFEGRCETIQFNHPCGIFAMGDGSILIADKKNHLVRKLCNDGNIITIAGTGRSGCGMNGDNPRRFDLSFPSDVFVYHGSIYIADGGNGRVVMIDNGRVYVVAGSGAKGFSGDGGKAVKAELNHPQSIYIDDSGELYIADTMNNRVRKVDKNGIIRTIVGGGEDYAEEEKDNLSKPTSFSLDHPISLYGHNGELYVSDTRNGRLLKIDGHSNVRMLVCDPGKSIPSPEFLPYGICISKEDGTMYVCDRGGNRLITLLDIGSIPILKKHPRDLSEQKIYAYRPILSLLAPSFLKNVIDNELVTTTFPATVQKLVDFIMYKKPDLTEYDCVETLVVLGLANEPVFNSIQIFITADFVQMFGGDASIPMSKKILDFYNSNNFSSELLKRLYDYTAVGLSFLIDNQPSLVEDPVIVECSHRIIKARFMTSVPGINLLPHSRSKMGKLCDLFNDATSSDVIVTTQSKRYYCHKTILSSASPILEKMIITEETNEDGDLVHTYFQYGNCLASIHIDSSRYGEDLIEMALRACYASLQAPPSSHPSDIYDCLSHYGLSSSATTYIDSLPITSDNIFQIADSKLIDHGGMYRRLIDFALENIHEIFLCLEGCKRFNNKLKDDIFIEYLRGKNK